MSSTEHTMELPSGEELYPEVVTYIERLNASRRGFHARVQQRLGASSSYTHVISAPTLEDFLRSFARKSPEEKQALAWLVKNTDDPERDHAIIQAVLDQHSESSEQTP